ncbi:amidohydrolase family protein [Catellatospora bangladeshensis]|uniref:Amidohydrolase n=1 Tax=Catellatospora bangladeshensis TaxID=310355 RepID=A0A8J3JQM7_9ACTN|nr:amidohydrolase family protein [Catellatospora bangladeshensis]GIF83295.1 amidohydrolase [Catellatospora bangladeshensis]
MILGKGDHVRIDAHHHLWTADYAWLGEPGLERLRRDYTVDDLRRELPTAKIDFTVLVEAGQCRLEETERFLALAGQTPEIAGVVGWASLTDPDLPGTIAALLAGPGGDLLVGIRDQVQAVADPAYLARPDVRGALRAIGSAGLAFDLVVRADQLPACAAAVQAVPNTMFVLDHLGKPSITADGLRDWRDAVAPLAICDNAVAKLSGLLTEAGPGWTAEAIAPFVETALELFGPDRVMVGSDWPVCELVATYADAISAVTQCLSGLSPSERAAVEGGTAVHTYDLEINR